MRWARRRWLCVEHRAQGARESARIVSRHWTRGGARVAAVLGAENWSHVRGEVKAGRAYWCGSWIQRYVTGIEPDPARRLAELDRLPWISYRVIPTARYCARMRAGRC